MRTRYFQRIFILKRLILASVAFLVMTSIYVQTAHAQYPRVPGDVREQAAQKMEAMNKRSDEAWAKALPIIKEWEAKGKPYIPWAAKPDDLRFLPFLVLRAAECTVSGDEVEKFS